MAAFVQGRPLTTREPVITVDAGLAIGTHRFQLVVVDSDGLRSRPDTVTVRIAAGVVGGVSPIGPSSPRNRRDRSPR